MSEIVEPTEITPPAGDPDEIEDSGRVLTTANADVASAHTAVTVASGYVEAGWMSTAAGEYQTQLTTLRGAIANLGLYNGNIIEQLQVYAVVLRAVQKDTAADARKLKDATDTHQRVVAAARKQIADSQNILDNMPPGHAGTYERGQLESEIATAKTTITQADTTFDQTQKRLVKNAQEASAALARSAAGVQRMLGEYTELTQTMAFAPINDVLQATATVAAAEVVGLTTKEVGELVTIARTLHTGNAEDIAALDAREFKEVEALAKAAGSDSYEAIAAWLAYQSRLLPSQLVKIGHAIDGLDSLSEAGTSLEKITSVLGKLGLGAGAIADLATIITGHGVDRDLAIANLFGTSLAAAGPLSDLLALNTLDEVPFVGQVIMITTAVAIGGKYVVDNWSKISAAMSDVGSTIEREGSKADQSFFSGLERALTGDFLG